MAGYDETHWADAERRIDSFSTSLKGKDQSEQAALAGAEIAVQMIYLNSFMEDLTSALHRIADSK